jgi:hypothetical protein
MKRFAAAALAAVLTAGCAAGTRGVPARSVVVEGWAPLGSLPRPEARRRALADAQRRAVEEAAGVEVAAVATVDGASSVRERVSTRGLGTVRRFTVLGEEASEGMLKLRVRAVVELPRAGAPARIGWIPGTGPVAKISAREGAGEAFTAAWTAYGGGVAAAGARGDLLLRVTASARTVDEPRVRPLVSVRVRLSASAAGTGGTVWAATRESAALGVDAEQASARALARAADALARAAATDLPARLWLQARSDPR